ncbi:hypothetical protein ABC383_10565 [Noviherbaspirillum sp. 1P10PC]|uniref:hypothetical protein n=1 Tax=Noviherbaspirillum sp. 1P10PC TaxID=3132292 RepID=UPI0039A10CD1
MNNAIDYFLRTENTVRMLLAENETCKTKVRLIQENIMVNSALSESLVSSKSFIDWWVKNKNEKDVTFEAHKRYSLEAFASSLLAGTVLQIAARAIELYSENTTVPNEWGKIVRRSFPIPKFFIGRTVHTVPVGLVIYSGRDQYLKTYSGRVIEAINQEVFARLANFSRRLEFQNFVERSSGFYSMHAEYLASNVLDILCWNSYDQYIEDMQQALL